MRGGADPVPSLICFAVAVAAVLFRIAASGVQSEFRADILDGVLHQMLDFVHVFGAH